MKKSTKFLLLMGALTWGAAASAQKSCNLAILATAAPSTVNWHDTAYITIKITNNGPASLNTSDTIYIGAPGSPTVFDLIPTGTIAPGGSQTFPNRLYIRHAIDTLTSNLTFSSCLMLHDQTDITKGGNPVPVTYNDPVATNDTSCMSITFKKKPTGIFEIADYGKQLSIYPNPATTEVKFDVNLDKGENIKVSVKDIAGREVMNKDFGMIVSGRQVQLGLDVSKLQSGIYFVEVNGTQKIATGKFVIK
jgi:hypothetical protein